MNIPFVDLKRQYHSIKSEIDASMAQIMENTIFVGGAPVKKFEEAFAKWMGVDEVVACGNGTDAIEIALQAMGIGHGDEVIVPAISWISTSETVSYVGAKPVFVDVHENGLINPLLIEEKLTTKTKAIIPVHLYGQSADMQQIMAIAHKHRLLVIEDCAQAHGACFKNLKVGTFGDAATFSFYPGKNLGAYGDGGCMIAKNADVRENMRRIANHGQLSKHDHKIEGRNSRLDSLQAAVLSVKLPYIDQWNEARRKVANWYQNYLKDCPIELPKIVERAEHVFHLFVIQTEKRDALKLFLEKAGIQTAIHYPTALPFVEAYRLYNYKESDFPQAIKNTGQILSLPMFPELEEKEVAYTAEKIKLFFHE